MAYLWQVYNKNQIYRIAKKISPYLEIEDTKIKIAQVNPLIRFEDIFLPLLNQEEIEDDERKELENIIFHFLALLDFKFGLYHFSVKEHIIEKEILNNYYGKDIKDRYYKLNVLDKQKICQLLRKRADLSNRKSLFLVAVRKIFAHARLYYNMSEQKFLLYLPYKPSNDNKNKLLLLQDLFWDITMNLEIFWNQHFGIMGQGETMKLGKMILY